MLTRPSRPAAIAALLVAALAAGSARPADAQSSVLVQGIADAELWATDSGSTLLTRNEGRPGLVGRLSVWGAAQLGSRVVVYAAGYLEGGSARHEPGTEWYTDLAGVRYTHSPALVLDAGKMAHPVGAFAPRRHSTRNPLIGVPDGYPVQYPVGVQLSGTHGRIDYRVAAVSLPIHREGYTPEPTPTARPALGLGITLATGVRIGASATWGPYLDRRLSPALLAGRSWRSFEQRVGAIDARLSRGYLELRGELAAARYEVPDAAAGAVEVDGFTYYAEAKYTLAPRLFIASRLERNDYAYIQPMPDDTWIAAPTDMYNAELGAGYRLSPRILLKASVRKDRWDVPPEMQYLLKNGTALALQLSHAFDLYETAFGTR